MEKFSKWRDPSTGIHPFLPVSPASSGTLVTVLVFPFALATALIRVFLLAVIALLHIVLVQGLCTLLTPLPPLYNTLHPLFTSLTTRSALFVLGFYSISDELVSPKRGSTSRGNSNGSVAQLVRPARRGDLVLANWTSYVDILYLAFKYDPVFVLPVFTPLPSTTSFGRSTGTGSAGSIVSPSAPLTGYTVIPFTQLLLRTGSLPPTSGSTYASLNDLHKSIRTSRPIALLPEGTTGNGRALLKLGEGVLSEPPPSTGIVWCAYIKHAPPPSIGVSSTCPLPRPVEHFWGLLATLPLSRAMSIRTLHPSASPSSPSFLPSEVVANAGASGTGIARLDEKSVWREAYAITLAETGRARRVAGMGWVEKAAFLEYYYAKRR